MPLFARSIVIACFAMMALPASAQSPAAAAPERSAPVPIADFFHDAVFGAPQLSPDGRHLAILVRNGTARDRLAIINLADTSMNIAAQFGETDVGDFQWVNSERLVYNSRDRRIAPGDVRYAPGLFAVNRDGTGFKRLADVRGRPTAPRVGAPLLPWNTFLMSQRGPQDSNFVYVTSPQLSRTSEVEAVDLLKLDTVSGRSTTVRRPGDTHRWLLDNKGEPRLAITREDNISSVHYLDPATTQWRKLTSYDTYLGGVGAFDPISFAPNGTLYVLNSLGGDKDQLTSYDLTTGKINRTGLVKLEQYDFRGHLLATSDKLLGVRYLVDAQTTTWFDDNMQAVQAKVDTLLPTTNNVIDVASRAETPWVLVRAYSDRQPSVYAVYNTETGKLTAVGQSQPRVQAARMATQKLVHIKARDGLSIPAWLTVPNDSAGTKLPLVVMVHGGPYTRGNQWGWSSNGQFLASRGYAVLEPEFRGSRGFGEKHFRAGWKQWGLAMQDDLADATRWAIAQGLVDPARVCIAGSSYGGYATLMGLIKDNALYKCGISWGGVTDIKLLYTGHWSATANTSEGYKQYGMPALVGDPVKDAAQLEATSPLLQAARITQPLLLAHGGADRRVPIYHGKKFYSAVKETNSNVEWVVYDDEANGWSLLATRVDFWGRVEKFLDQHIGAARPVQPAAK